nr:MAG TPA: AAA domain protein [Caudoviricetes sp.]
MKICKVKTLQIFSFPGGVFIGGHGQPAELLPTGKSFLGRKFAERGCCYERKTEAVL